MAQARCFGGRGTCQMTIASRSCWANGVEGSQAGQAPTCPVAHSTHLQDRAVTYVPWHVTSVCPPPSPRPGSFEEGPKLLSLTRSPLGPRNPSGPLSPLSP